VNLGALPSPSGRIEPTEKLLARFKSSLPIAKNHLISLGQVVTAVTAIVARHHPGEWDRQLPPGSAIL
jgi:hypothetical protein